MRRLRTHAARTASRTLVLGAIAATACSAARSDVDTGRVVTDEAVIARPDDCRPVPPGGSLQARLDDAAPGDVLCLEPGRHAGPITVATPLTLWGPRDAVITSGGAGTTVRIEGEGVRLLGITVDGSGGRFDLLDAAVHVAGEGHTVEGVRVVNAVFGILVEKASDITVRGNAVIGDADEALGLRGDGIRLWETKRSTIEGNLVRHSRDIVVWYSPDNRIASNVVEHGRYGTHFMYSHSNTVENNLYLYNVVGVFVMYSNDISLRDNIMAGAAGAAGMGVGLKESGNITAVGNRFLHDTIGLYLDTSPLQLDHENRFERNAFWMCRQGVVFHSSPHRNRFVANTFVDNTTQVAVDGEGDALDVAWEGNYFDDYAGYDLDGDGQGDIPYELRSLTSELTGAHPRLRFFNGTPALAMAEASSHLVPLFSPRPILRDESPSTSRTLPLRHQDADRSRERW